MDPVRFGLSIRALRRRRGWTQAELARRARLSPSSISRIERGNADRVTLRALTRLADVLAARLSVRLLWQGEELDRLLDRDHASLVEWAVRRLTDAGWFVAPEATFSIRGERGSIDVLAWHPATGHLLVVEVKSVVPDVQATLAGVDRKVRVAPIVARDRGWMPGAGTVSRILVLPDDRTARRRVDPFAATFSRSFPARTVEVRRWISAPDRPISGVLRVNCPPGASSSPSRPADAARRARNRRLFLTAAHHPGGWRGLGEQRPRGGNLAEAPGERPPVPASTPGHAPGGCTSPRSATPRLRHPPRQDPAGTQNGPRIRIRTRGPRGGAST